MITGGIPLEIEKAPENVDGERPGATQHNNIKSVESCFLLRATEKFLNSGTLANKKLFNGIKRQILQ